MQVEEANQEVNKQLSRAIKRLIELNEKKIRDGVREEI